MNVRRLRLYLLVPAAVILPASSIWLTYVLYTSRQPSANDFYPRWAGTCALLREGLNPYSKTVTLRIQEGIYGRAARPDEDQVAFAYPLYASLVVWPLCATGNYPLVQAIWLWVLLGMLVTATALSVKIADWHPRLAVWALTILWSICLYHNFRALVLGQFAVLVLFAMAISVWAIRRGYDWLAGAFLALSTVKPQMVYLAVPWVLVWAAGKRRWRVWAGFGITLAFLVVGPMVVLPSWVPDFVGQVRTYPSYTVYGSLTWIIVQHMLGLGTATEIAVQVLLAATALGLSLRFWRGNREHMLWILGLLLLLTNFLTPRIATTNYLTLMPWVIWGLGQIDHTYPRSGIWAVLAVEAVALVAPWVAFAATLEGDFERAPAYIPFPVLVVALLIWLWPRVMSNRRDAAVCS